MVLVFVLFAFFTNIFIDLSHKLTKETDENNMIHKLIVSIPHMAKHMTVKKKCLKIT